MEKGSTSDQNSPAVRERNLFLTGATGYIGERLLRRIAQCDDITVRCLVRESTSLPADLQQHKSLEKVVGDLCLPQQYREALTGCDCVVHLAALTGKARPADYFRVNAEATRELIEVAREAGVRDFLHISTVAVNFPDQTKYYYAHSKRQAEEHVAEGGLAYTILRPTIVIGDHAPGFESLRRMASLPIMPIFGGGGISVQPVFVEDLVDGILAILHDGRFRGETLELGGPEILSMEEFLNRIRSVCFDKPPRRVHIPLVPLRAVLGFLERFALPWLPFTAGQLAAFQNDSTAAPHSYLQARLPQRKSPADVLRTIANHE